MFGMEKEKGKKETLFTFDLEKELKDQNTRKKYAKRIEERINTIKELLRKGKKKDEFDQLGVLLNGYHALAIVLGRATAKPSKGS